MQGYMFHQVGEEMNAKTTTIGVMPAVRKQKILKPATGDIVQLVLPGGGDMVLKVWASMRIIVFALAKWCRSGAFDTPAFKHTAKQLEVFSDSIEGLPNFALLGKS